MANKSYSTVDPIAQPLSDSDVDLVTQDVGGTPTSGRATLGQRRVHSLTSPENVQTDDYTLVLTDAFKMVCMDKATAVNLTVPPEASADFPEGTRIDISQDGAGQVTVVAGSGVTIRTPETLKLRKQRAKATLIKRVGTDLWDLEGNLEAAP